MLYSWTITTDWTYALTWHLPCQRANSRKCVDNEGWKASKCLFSTKSFWIHQFRDPSPSRCPLPLRPATHLPQPPRHYPRTSLPPATHLVTFTFIAEHKLASFTWLLSFTAGQLSCFFYNLQLPILIASLHWLLNIIFQGKTWVYQQTNWFEQKTNWNQVWILQN